MNTKPATTQIKLKNWAMIIKNQKDSEFKVKEYCAQHNISKDAYYYWYKKVKETALHESGFVEITQPSSITPAAPDNILSGEFRIQYRGIQITLLLCVPKDIWGTKIFMAPNTIFI